MPAITYKHDIVDEIVLEEEYEKLKACIQCGNCTAICPAGRYTPMRTHNLMRKALTGLEEVLSDKQIWMCSTCFNCYEKCIRHIPVTEILIKLRQIAVRKGHLPSNLKGVIKNLTEYGHAVPLGGPDSVWKKLREELGLPGLPPTIENNPEKLNELYVILRLIKFNQRIPFR